MKLTEDQISEQICAWFVANGVNPKDVLADSATTVSEGQLTFRQFARNENGARYVDPDDGRRLAQETVTVAVIKPPTPFIREWLRRGAPSPAAAHAGHWPSRVD